MKCNTVQYIISVRIQICSVELDRKDIAMNKLVATTLEGKYHLFDMRTQHPKKGFASLVEKVEKRELLSSLSYYLLSSLLFLFSSSLLFFGAICVCVYMIRIYDKYVTYLSLRRRTSRQYGAFVICHRTATCSLLAAEAAPSLSGNSILYYVMQCSARCSVQ